MTASQGSVIPAVPEGSPTWVYVVAVVAGLLVVLIGALPTIIEKLRPAQPTTTPPAVPDRPASGAQPSEPAEERSPPTDTLRAMILDLQGRLTRSEQREDALQERLLEMTDQLATARAKITQLESQVQMLSMRRD